MGPSVSGRHTGLMTSAAMEGSTDANPGSPAIFCPPRGEVALPNRTLAPEGCGDIGSGESRSLAASLTSVSLCRRRPLAASAGPVSPRGSASRASPRGDVRSPPLVDRRRSSGESGGRRRETATAALGCASPSAGDAGAAAAAAAPPSPSASWAEPTDPAELHDPAEPAGVGPTPEALPRPDDVIDPALTRCRGPVSEVALRRSGRATSSIPVPGMSLDGESCGETAMEPPTSWMDSPDDDGPTGAHAGGVLSDDGKDCRAAERAPVS